MEIKFSIGHYFGEFPIVGNPKRRPLLMLKPEETFLILEENFFMATNIPNN